MLILGLIMGGILAFYGMSFFCERWQQEKENGKQEETSNQNQTKINNIVISLFLVICIVFLLVFTFGQAFLAGGITGVVIWFVINKNRILLTSFLHKLSIFSSGVNEGIGKPVFEDLFTFSGRRNRKSYILLQLLYILIQIVFLITISIIGIVGFVVVLFAAFCSFIVTAQRLRDIGLPGKLCLLFLIPSLIDLFLFGTTFALISITVGFTGWIVLMSIPGTVGENKYGPDPLKIHKGG